jgi:copper(I)-binding protein
MKLRLAPAPLLLAGLLFAGGAFATDAAQVKASHAWIRVMPGNLPAGAYVVLENRGDHPVSLRSASSEAYGDVMLHKSSTEGGMGRMEMAESLSIPAHGKAALAPGGYHLMLMQATHPVQVGDKVKISLKFADGSALDTDFAAMPANTVEGGEAAAEHHGH